MTDTPLSLVEQHLYQQLFVHQLNWSAPDHPPISYTSDDGHMCTATNISSYKGLRVWVCDDKPGSKIEAELDRMIAKTSTDRLVIFHNDDEQVWRWPARRLSGNSTTTRLTSHRHRTGRPNPKFAARLDAIQLPIDVALDANAVLMKVRDAFDVEAQNETKRASKLMARMYAALEKAYPKDFDAKARDHEISVTLARILFLMFGDDTEMWETDAFRDFIHHDTPADGSTLGAQLNELITQLDTPKPKSANRVADLPYVNGGIFHEKITLPDLNKEFRDAVLDACAVDWSTISPAIFGSMFQSVRDAQTRRELGEHYTSEENILKTLNPLFLDELRAEFDRARIMKDEKGVLTRLWKRLGDIRYMDPACGCGNFIIVAFRELRDLELRIMERLQELAGASQLAFDPSLSLKVTLDHFYGIEIDEWPARIAETAMFLVDRQCDLKLKERFGEAPKRLPIQTQSTIVVANATRQDWGEVVAPSDNLIIAGNPPFVGKYTKTDEQTADAKNAWGSDYDGYLDYVTSWHAKALALLKDTNARWAFVTTNSITQGQAVPALFGPIFRDGWRIKFAHRTFPWTSEATGKAAVHCVIVGFTNDVRNTPQLFSYDTPTSPPRIQTVSNINAYLLDGSNLLVDKRRRPLPGLPEVLYGSKPADGGFLSIKNATAYADVVKDPVAKRYVHRFVGASELLEGGDRWCLWLVDATEADIKASPVLQDRLSKVRQNRLESKKAQTKQAAQNPGLFTEIRQPSEPYLAIPIHVSEDRRYFTATRFDENVICSNANFTAADSDGYLFSIISSTMFITWQRMIGGRIKSDLRFSNTVVWNNFPMPAVNANQRAKIVHAGAVITTVRAKTPEKSLAELYEPDSMAADLLAAHDALDAMVDAAFMQGSKDSCRTERDRQQLLFARYEQLTALPTAATSTARIRR